MPYVLKCYTNNIPSYKKMGPEDVDTESNEQARKMALLVAQVSLSIIVAGCFFYYTWTQRQNN